PRRTVSSGNDSCRPVRKGMSQMQIRFIRALLVVAVSVAVYGGTARATPPSGVTSKVFAVGQFDEIKAKTLSSSWQARISTKGESDLHVLENTIVQGGSFGWHSHPGPSLVIVKTGALTLYRGDDPTCTPQVVEAGSGFVDNGGDVHLVRNEGSVVTVVYVTSLVPRGAVRRIDEPSPGNCPF
ncbi:MAG TPA: cupin domain-containing protein, partial [Vicinamibacteria bacterium]|nr:cupin domain-containing protein [Vicinamibacteria bacterium]